MHVDTIAVAAASKPQPTAASAERAPHVRWVHDIAIARVRFGAGRRCDVAIPSAKTDAQAKARALIVAQLARRLRKANADSELVRRLLTSAGAAATDKDLRAAVRAVEKVVGGESAIAGVPTAPTVKTVGERWTSGELARSYPDQVRVKRTSAKDVQRLARYVYPLVGNVAIDRFELDDAERVMRALPVKLSSTTRRQIAHLMSRILTLAVFPLRLIPHSPIPKGFLPKTSRPRAFSYLFPSEDAQLLACAAVPLNYRILYGWLMREGMRVGEALALSTADLDFARGRVRLDINKSDDARIWVTAPGAASALRIYCERYRPGLKPNDAIIVDVTGKPFTSAVIRKLAARFRAHLKLAGITRPELFERSAARNPIRIHDLRASFVSLSLARGQTENWISDRTGHKDWRVMKRYARVAREFSELDERVGELAPLDQAIPELRAAALDDEPPPATSDEPAQRDARAPAWDAQPAAALTASSASSASSSGSSKRARTASNASSASPCDAQHGHRLATSATTHPLAIAAISTTSHRKSAARETRGARERRSLATVQKPAETADPCRNRERSSRIVGAHGQHVASLASHGGGPSAGDASSATTARASLESALAMALSRATDAGAWQTVSDIARAIQVALATTTAAQPPTGTETATASVIDLESARQRQPR